MPRSSAPASRLRSSARARLRERQRLADVDELSAEQLPNRLRELRREIEDAERERAVARVAEAQWQAELAVNELARRRNLVGE